MTKFILLLVIITVASPSFSQEVVTCDEYLPLPAEVLKLAPVDVHVVLGPSSQSFSSPQKSWNSFYDVKDLALDAALVGGILASRPYLPEDKFKHLVAGAGISYVTTTVAKVYFRGQNHAQLKAVLAGLTAATLIGIAKELRDRRGYGTPEVNDALVTSLGGALVSVRFTVKF